MSRVLLPSQRGRRDGFLVLALLVLSAFSPYIWGRVRLDALIVYPVALAVLLLGMVRGGSIPRAKHAFVVGLGMLFLILWPLMVSLFHLPSAQYFDEQLVARLDNFLRPLGFLAVTVAIVFRLSDAQRFRMKSSVAKLVVSMALLNVALVLLHNAFGIRGFLEPFHAPVSGERAGLWDRAASMGRLTGIFGSPFEAGSFYGIALLTAIWLQLNRIWPRLILLAVPGIFIGGALAVSRAFLLVALPIAAVYWLTSLFMQRSGRNASTLQPAAWLTGAACAAGAAAVTFWTNWPGRERFLQQMDLWDVDSGFAIGRATGGRFGASDGVGRGIVHEISSGQWLGHGLHYRGVVDSAYYEHMMTGGLFNLAVYVGLLVIICLFSFTRGMTGADRGLAVSLSFLLLALSLGAPVWTMNRIAAVVWVILGLWILWPGQAHAQVRSVPRPSDALRLDRRVAHR